MKEVESFKAQALEHNACSKYMALWDSCKSKKQFMDLALNVGCTDYLCNAIAEGWGVSADVIADKFGAYINDRYIAEEAGYTSKMYASFSQSMMADATQVVLIGCSGTLFLPDNAICEVKVVNSSITIVGNGICNIRRYGNCDIEIKDKTRCHEL